MKNIPILHKKMLRTVCGLFLPLGAVLMLSGCAYPLFFDLKPADFTTEIQQYKAARNDPDSSVRATSHYRLAVLYSHHSNPSPDYPLALKELEAFIALDPQRAATDEVRNRLTLLRELERANGENRKLIKENRELKNSVEQLTRENREFKDTLEKMERLDIMIEEKRKKQLR